MPSSAHRPIKPIFQFYKPVNYNFELLFWVEKVLLTGVVGIGLGRIVALRHRSSNLLPDSLTYSVCLFF